MPRQGGNISRQLPESVYAQLEFLPQNKTNLREAPP